MSESTVTVSFGRFTMFTDALPEFRADWLLASKATSTVGCHLSLLRLLGDTHDSPGLADVRVWVGDASTVSMRRKRVQAVRAFGRWSESIGDNDFPWWRNLPVPTEAEKPQPTATPADFEAGLSVLSSCRDRAVLSVLWCCGLRRPEAAPITRLVSNARCRNREADFTCSRHRQNTTTASRRQAVRRRSCGCAPVR